VQPTPTPAPTPSASSCHLGNGGGSGQNCPRTDQHFLQQVTNAIQLVEKQHPEYFDFGTEKGTGNFLVIDTQGFTSAVVDDLNATGLCAEFDGEELGVKNTNDFNDQYDILTSANFIRSGDGSYRATCRPAWF
jgi:hypothetical protein